MLEEINRKIGNSPYFFISKEAERGLGLEELIQSMKIIASERDYVSEGLEKMGKCLVIEDPNGSAGVVESEGFAKLIDETKSTAKFASSAQVNDEIYLQFFKNTSDAAIDDLKSRGYSVHLLNNSAQLTRKLENKVTQFQYLYENGLAKYLPEAKVISLAKLDEVTSGYKDGYVVQLPFGHTGSSTYIIDEGWQAAESRAELAELKTRFPNRAVRVVRKIHGHAFTINACICGGNTYMGGLSYQFTGIEGLANRSSATVGNDWSLPKQIMKPEIYEQINEMVTFTGEILREKFGFRGMFGVDFIYDEEQTQIFLIEINPRQIASIPMHTKLQLKVGQIPLSLLHLAEFLELDKSFLPEVKSYNENGLLPIQAAQLILRLQSKQDLKITEQRVKPGLYRQLSDNSAREYIRSGKSDDVLFLDKDEDRPLIWQKDILSISDFGEEGFFLNVKGNSGDKLFVNGDEIARIQANMSLGYIESHRDEGEDVNDSNNNANSVNVSVLPFARDALTKVHQTLLY